MTGMSSHTVDGARYLVDRQVPARGQAASRPARRVRE